MQRSGLAGLRWVADRRTRSASNQASRGTRAKREIAVCMVGLRIPAALYERAALCVAKILKGAKAAELPVEQPTRFEMVVNVNTANTLGLTVPPALLTQADDVIG